eukprot:UN23647
MLGKLSPSQIEKGMVVLQDIESSLGKSKKKLNGLSSQFFSLIPTNFGRRVPVPITTLEMVKEKEELLKFWLRMGFDEVDDCEDKTPIEGIMEKDLPSTLKAACKSHIGTMICDDYDIEHCLNRAKDMHARKAGR